MRVPPPVQSVRLVGPSSPIPPERLQRGQDKLRELGFRVHGPAPMEAQAYLADHDPQRRALLAEAFEDPEVDGVMSTRGGYGAARLLEVDPTTWLPRVNRALIGFSDITALHLLLQSWGQCSIHGPGAGQLPDLDEASGERFCQVLSGRWRGLRYPADQAPLVEGRAEGRLVGGCLSVIASVAGTGLLDWPEGCILLLEDIGEVPYRLDRCLTQLRSCGAMARVGGVVIGDLVRCEAPQNRPPRPGEPSAPAAGRYPSPLEVMAERLGDLGVPVLAGLPIGHADRNWAIPLGARARLDTARGELELLEPGAAD